VETGKRAGFRSGVDSVGVGEPEGEGGGEDEVVVLGGLFGSDGCFRDGTDAVAFKVDAEVGELVEESAGVAEFG
jgi:hypothetical protein